MVIVYYRGVIMLRWSSLPTYAKWYLVGLLFLSIIPIGLSVYYTKFHVPATKLKESITESNAMVAQTIPTDYMAALSHSTIMELEEDEVYEHDFYNERTERLINRRSESDRNQYSLEEIGGFIGTINGVALSWFALWRNRRNRSPNNCKIE